MGRKEKEELALLKAQNQSLVQELKSSRELYNDVMLDKEQLGKMLEDAGKKIDTYSKKIEEMSRIPLLDLTVNVTGVQDINKTLDDAMNLMNNRIASLGMKDKFKILAHPHTMAISEIG